AEGFWCVAKKDQFSWSWISRVQGGKGHEFVVAVLSVFAGPVGVADDGVLIDPRQAGGLPHPTAVLQVAQDVEGPGVGQADAEEGRALALGEAFLTGAAGEHPALLGPIAEADAEVALATQAIVLAVGVLAAEQVQLVHGGHRGAKSTERWPTPRWDCRKALLRWQR